MCILRTHIFVIGFFLSKGRACEISKINAPSESYTKSCSTHHKGKLFSMDGICAHCAFPHTITNLSTFSKSVCGKAPCIIQFVVLSVSNLGSLHSILGFYYFYIKAVLCERSICATAKVAKSRFVAQYLNSLGKRKRRRRVGSTDHSKLDFVCFAD